MTLVQFFNNTASTRMLRCLPDSLAQVFVTLAGNPRVPILQNAPIIAPNAWNKIALPLVVFSHGLGRLTRKYTESN